MVIREKNTVVTSAVNSRCHCHGYYNTTNNAHTICLCVGIVFFSCTAFFGNDLLNVMCDFHHLTELYGIYRSFRNLWITSAIVFHVLR